MMIPHVVNTEADKVFVNFLNVQAVTANSGDSVVWDTGTPDGVRATQPITATLGLFVGIVDVDVPAGNYGLAQVYGYRASALVTNETNVTLALGDILTPFTGADYLKYSADSTNKKGLYGNVFIAEAVASAVTTLVAATLKKVFLKAL